MSIRSLAKLQAGESELVGKLTFISVLIEAPERIDLIVSTIVYRSIDQAGRPLPTGP